MSDKILKLDQAQTLYQDLRGRIDALPTSSDIPEVPVQDVQVDGTSIVQNGVASVPIVNTINTLGLVKVNTDYGLNVYPSGLIRIWEAGSAEVKGGTHQSKPLAPDHQHESVFYGLSKVAGVDLKNETVTLGEYPEASKTAIKEMLGVQDGLKVVRLI